MKFVLRVPESKNYVGWEVVQGKEKIFSIWLLFISTLANWDSVSFRDSTDKGNLGRGSSLDLPTLCSIVVSNSIRLSWWGNLDLLLRFLSILGPWIGQSRVLTPDTCYISTHVPTCRTMIPQTAYNSARESFRCRSARIIGHRFRSHAMMLPPGVPVPTG